LSHDFLSDIKDKIIIEQAFTNSNAALNLSKSLHFLFSHGNLFPAYQSCQVTYETHDAGLLLSDNRTGIPDATDSAFLTLTNI